MTRRSAGPVPALALAASLVLLVAAIAIVRPASPPVASASLTDEMILREIRGLSGVESPTVLGRATTQGHTVVYFEGRREWPAPARDVFGSMLWNGSEKAVAQQSEELTPPVEVSVLGARSSGAFSAGVSGSRVEGTMTQQPGFVAGLIRDDRVTELEIRDDRGASLRTGVSAPVFLVALDDRFHPSSEKSWRLLDGSGAPIWVGDATRGTRPFSPSDSPPPLPAPSVVDMLPRTVNGVEMQLSHVDASTGALRQVVRRLGRTSADVEAAGRSPMDATTGSVTGVRIAHVEGDRLLEAYTEVTRNIVEQDGEELRVEPVSLGDKRVTKLDHTKAPRPIYLFVTDDTLFTVADATEATAADWFGQIP
jgi:hypothetical protein